MDVTKAKLNDWLSRKTTDLIIPIFQRSYAWEKEQCQQLFEDIENSKPDKNHFLGVICYIRHNKKVTIEGFHQDDVYEYVIIDGQQRITTAMLLLKAMMKKIPYKQKDIQDFLSNNTGSNDYKFRLKPTKKDMSTYMEIMGDKEITNKNSKLYTNYQYFSEEVDKLNDDKLYKIYGSLLKLEIAEIILDKEDNAQAIFESINSTGKRLSPVDLIRNFLMMDKEKDGQEQIFKKYWDPIEKNLIDEKEEKLEQFMEHFLRIHYKNDLVSRDIYSSFKKLTKDTFSSDSNKILEELLKFSKIYALFLGSKDNLSYFDDKQNKILMEKLKQISTLEFRVSYPFIMKIIDDFMQKNLSFEHLIDFLDVLISYYIRRKICNKASNGLNKIMYDLYTNLEKEGYINLQNLQKILGKRVAEFPNNQEFEKAFNDFNAYKHKSITRFILIQLEYKDNKEKLVEDELSIEHFYPQNTGKYSEEWKNLDRENYEEIKTNYIDNFGNLTLTGQNSSLGNSPFKEKVQKIKDNGNIQLNKYFENVETWNLEEIKKRNKSLFEQTQKIFKDIPKDLRQTNNNSADFYTLSESFDPTDTKPKKILFPNNESKSVESWKKVFIAFLTYLYKNHTDDFLKFINQKPAPAYVKSEKFNKTLSYEQIDGLSEYYFITNYSAKQIVYYMVKTIDDLELDGEDFQIEI